VDWGLGALVHAASLVASELVTTSTIDAGTGTGIDLTVAWNREGLRLAVRGSGPGTPRQRYPQHGLVGLGQKAVAGLSRAFGVLPTEDGGKVVWAVLNAAMPQPLTGPTPPRHTH
jgi:hypothetical protein